MPDNLPTNLRGDFERLPGKPILVMSGHGSWAPADGYFQVPAGSRLCFFTEFGKTLSDRFGGRIEKYGVAKGNLPDPDRVHGAFMTAPDMRLHPPYHPTLDIKTLSRSKRAGYNVCQVCLWDGSSPSYKLSQILPAFIGKKAIVNGVEHDFSNGADIYWAACSELELKGVGGESFGVNDCQR